MFPAQRSGVYFPVYHRWSGLSQRVKMTLAGSGKVPAELQKAPQSDVGGTLYQKHKMLNYIELDSSGPAGLGIAFYHPSRSRAFPPQFPFPQERV